MEASWRKVEAIKTIRMISFTISFGASLMAAGPISQRDETAPSATVQRASIAGARRQHCNLLAPPPLQRQEKEAMMITVLAAAMTVLMLIATAVGMHQEAERVRLKDRSDKTRGFGRH
jgi:hypothetical protein